MTTISIRPSNIDAGRHLFNTFDHSETETSAGWIVRFCQQRDGDDWRPFDHADLLAYYQERRLIGINKGIDRDNAKARAQHEAAVARYEAAVAAWDEEAEQASYTEAKAAWDAEQAEYKAAVDAWHDDSDNDDRGPFPAYPQLKPVYPPRAPQQPDEPRINAHRTECNETFRFNRLCGSRHRLAPWVFQGEDGLYHITKDFVVRCFRSSPVAEFPGTSPEPAKEAAA